MGNALNGRPFHFSLFLTDKSQRLGVHAFNTVLSRKKGLYQDVMRELSKQISCSGYTALKREFGALVRDGLAEFKNIDF